MVCAVNNCKEVKWTWPSTSNQVKLGKSGERDCLKKHAEHGNMQKSFPEILQLKVQQQRIIWSLRISYIWVIKVK